jgi:toxin ParE1/3/4
MAKYFLTNKAVEDLSSIWNNTKHKWTEKQANQYYFFLLELCSDVANNPILGKE